MQVLAALRVVAEPMLQLAEVGERRGQLWMMKALEQGDRALVVALRGGNVSLAPVDHAEVIERHRIGDVTLADGIAEDGERALERTTRGRIVVLLVRDERNRGEREREL